MESQNQQPSNQLPPNQQPPIEPQQNQYPSFEQISTQQQSNQQPVQQPPMQQPPIQQPPNQHPPNQQPPNQQPPYQQPPYQQPPNQQPPYQQPPNQQPPMQQPPIQQPPYQQPPYQQPPNQQPQNQQPPYQQPPNQQPPMQQPPYQQPPNQQTQNYQPPSQQPPNQQPPMQQPPMQQPPYQQPPNQQPPMQQPPYQQPPYQQPPNQLPPNQQPPNQQPQYQQPPNQQPPNQQPPFQSQPPQFGTQSQFSQYGTQPPQYANQSQPPQYGTQNQFSQYGTQYQPPQNGTQYQPPYAQPNQSSYYNPPPYASQIPHYNGPSPYASQPPHYNGPSPYASQAPHYNGPSPYASQAPLYNGPSPYASQIPHYNGPSPNSSQPPHFYAPHYGPQAGVPHQPYMTQSYAPQYGPHTSALYNQPPNIGKSTIGTGNAVIKMNHRRGDALQPGSWIPVREQIIMVGLGWDVIDEEEFDLDASVSAYDLKFKKIDAIYFNNLTGLRGSVTHFGDNLTGEGEGDDEVIKIKLNAIPENVYYLAVTVNSYKKNSIKRAKSASIRLYTSTYEIGKYTLNRTKDCIGLLLGIFERDPSETFWYFRVMADTIKGNTVIGSVSDIQTLLKQYSMSFNSSTLSSVRHPLPGEPIIQFNKFIKLDNRFTYIGLGWKIIQGLSFDLDASIISFDSMNNIMEIVFHQNLRSYDGSIVHYGDDTSGIKGGEGDNEILSIDFGALDPNICTMAVVVNSFKGNSMRDLKNAYIRLYDVNKPIGVHVLNNCPDCVGLFFGIFRKDNQGMWHFSAIKEVVNGIVATESANDVIYKLNNYPLK